MKWSVFSNGGSVFYTENKKNCNNESDVARNGQGNKLAGWRITSFCYYLFAPLLLHKYICWGDDTSMRFTTFGYIIIASKQNSFILYM